MNGSTAVAQPEPTTLNGSLTDRLTRLSSISDRMGELPACEIRGHVAGVRAFLHDDVLRHAHAEELVLFPAFDRLGADGGRLALGLLAEHDTIRDATRSLGEAAARPLSTATIRTLSGLLDGVGLLLDAHLGHESTAAMELLGGLHATEQARLRARLAALDTPVTTTPCPWWLPEELPREATIGSADLLEPEGLVGASCDPGVLAVVRSAVAASTEHVDELRWRAALAEHSRYRLLVRHAVQCMRESGIWPWTPHLPEHHPSEGNRHDHAHHDRRTPRGRPTADAGR